ncbi:uncharacterized protein LOC131302206 isoform X2 [Rhododendron vialii]|uniref:uncharacterized protein LOC131302206 isoform X2 n=1 Tax=Rhododendron vialii TaxID=182163 RepID=UPI00265D7986|nr:uncharacterized protein LOC131302206 isoform X2 [Rhododendron vialii]
MSAEDCSLPLPNPQLFFFFFFLSLSLSLSLQLFLFTIPNHTHVCYIIAVQVTDEAADNLGGRTGFLCNNVAVLQRSPPSEPLVAATGSTRIARSGELSVPFPRQLLEMFLQ